MNGYHRAVTLRLLNRDIKVHSIYDTVTIQGVSVCALSQLFFIMAVAILYVTAQGIEVVETKKRRWVDPHWFRGNSYFRIGWQWVKTALEQGWTLIGEVCFKDNYDPEPAIASRKQEQQRRVRLEFEVQTCCY